MGKQMSISALSADCVDLEQAGGPAADRFVCRLGLDLFWSLRAPFPSCQYVRSNPRPWSARRAGSAPAGADVGPGRWAVVGGGGPAQRGRGGSAGGGGSGVVVVVDPPHQWRRRSFPRRTSPPSAGRGGGGPGTEPDRDALRIGAGCCQHRVCHGPKTPAARPPHGAGPHRLRRPPASRLCLAGGWDRLADAGAGATESGRRRSTGGTLEP